MRRVWSPGNHACLGSTPNAELLGVNYGNIMDPRKACLPKLHAVTTLGARHPFFPLLPQESGRLGWTVSVPYKFSWLGESHLVVG